MVKIMTAVFWILAARCYSHLVRWSVRYLRWCPPGLGWLCRRIKLEFALAVEGRRYYFWPPAASMYSCMIAGRYPEPETHLFFAKLFPALGFDVAFVDVGAAVGEMTVDVAGYANVRRVIGFEADPACAEACRLSACINNYHHISIVAAVVADAPRPLQFEFRSGRGGSGSISQQGGSRSQSVNAVMLDDQLAGVCLPVVLLIDTEGAEPLVMRGGANFIASARPLIIFEFNHISRAHYQLDDIKGILGAGYEIYRLRSDGQLDKELNSTWNCLAVHADSPFHAICHRLLTDQDAATR